ARPWLRFLGWWREQPIEVPFQGLLNRYITWMRDERGFTTESVRQLQCQAKMFLQWYAKNRRQLSDLRPADIDHYFASEGVQRWSRISTRNVASALRMFFRYAAKRGFATGAWPIQFGAQECTLWNLYPSRPAGRMCRRSWPSP